MTTKSMFFLICYTLLFVSLTVGQDLNLTAVADCLSVVSTQTTCPHPNVKFWLYNNNVTAYHLDPTNNNTIINAPFLNNKTIFILNGFTGNVDNYVNEYVRPEYIKLNYDVISLDYASLVPYPCYLEAVQNVDVISRCFTDFLKYVLELNKVLIQKVHVVGFSLGAQIGGKAGKLLKSETGKAFPRLTGLDAALPLFYGPLSYIDSTSADFVDAIHTNSLIAGKLEPIGTVDFYVNDIFFQSQCIGIDISIESNLIVCSHNFAHKYFAASFLTSPVFCGTPIDVMNQTLIGHKEKMGEYVSLSARGIYWVTNTTGTYPYAQDKSC